jgi:hypothetical protein
MQSITSEPDAIQKRIQNRGYGTMGDQGKEKGCEYELWGKLGKAYIHELITEVDNAKDQDLKSYSHPRYFSPDK